MQISHLGLSIHQYATTGLIFSNWPARWANRAMSADFKAAGTIATAYSIGRNEKPNCYEVKEIELLE